MLQLKYFGNKLLYLLFFTSLIHYINIEMLHFCNYFFFYRHSEMELKTNQDNVFSSTAKPENIDEL
jgi:hypothetical protein